MLYLIFVDFETTICTLDENLMIYDPVFEFVLCIVEKWMLFVKYAFADIVSTVQWLAII